MNADDPATGRVRLIGGPYHELVVDFPGPVPSGAASMDLAADGGPVRYVRVDDPERGEVWVHTEQPEQSEQPDLTDPAWRKAPCPNGQCSHPGAAHCRHADGYIHCTGGCTCTPWPRPTGPDVDYT